MSSLSRSALSIGQPIGQYRIVRRLGGGAMADVYEGFDESMQRQVALKVLHPELADDESTVARFFNEGLAANVARHPGIVAAFEQSRLADSRPYMVMEYLDGEPLSKRMARGRLPEREVIRLVRQIASSLSAVHAKGIIHRDLKPGNVMIVADPEVPGGERTKILDFGIAKVPEEYQDRVRTRDGSAIGTPTFMAPEQWGNAKQVTGAADVYSLGIMSYMMLAGQRPFSPHNSDDMTLAEWMVQHFREEPRNLSEIRPELTDGLVELVHRMLNKMPNVRPSAAAVATELDRLSQLTPPRLTPDFGHNLKQFSSKVEPERLFRDRKPGDEE